MSFFQVEILLELPVISLGDLVLLIQLMSVFTSSLAVSYDPPPLHPW